MIDNINEWVGRARSGESAEAAPAATGVKVIRKEASPNRGQVIIELAEKLRPIFQNFFKDRRDNSGMLIQPAHVRAVALNCAEHLVKSQDNTAAA